MLDHDAADRLLVFRRPSTPTEADEADALMGGGVAGTGPVTVYALVDIERRRPPTVAAAVEVSVAASASGSWELRRAGGDASHHRRLATELARLATTAGASRITLADAAPRTARQLMRSWPGVVGVDGGFWAEL